MTFVSFAPGLIGLGGEEAGAVVTLVEGEAEDRCGGGGEDSGGEGGHVGCCFEAGVEEGDKCDGAWRGWESGEAIEGNLEAADEEGCWWVGLSGERGVGFHCCGGFSGKPEAYLIEATVATNQQFSAAVTTEHNLINSR